jgi:glycosyltransferase involved in cell wall biosynthesis
MRILMLGWEFPPFIAGGLGVACHGLTRALDRAGHEVVFILPRSVDRSQASHVKLLSPDEARERSRLRISGKRGKRGGEDAAYTMPGFDRTVFHSVAASFSHPYPLFDSRGGGTLAPGASPDDAAAAMTAGVSDGLSSSAPLPMPAAQAGGYGGDLLGDAERYARLVVALARDESFDVIHAHDWLTFPAGIALARVVDKPLVVHVHSTEFDRSGEGVNQPLYDIERRGMHEADRVVAVSAYTKGICVERYGIGADKVDVVYNGIEREEEQPAADSAIEAGDKIVLFLGRITMQKGPEYFISAAKRVLERVENVKFVVAGSGDQARSMIEQAAAMGIGHKVLFTGFLRGRDVERVFRMADCYVMPSVSEPFGIAALEAIHHDVPVIISKQSGVSEVLTHVLKVDFWDIDEMANKIVAVLRHPPLSQTLRHHGTFELRWLTWDGAAEKCVETYRRAIGQRASMARA